MYQRIVIQKHGGPDVLKLISEATLPEPQANEVRLKVLASSVSFTDTMIRSGNYPAVREKPPFSPGYDLIGIIDKIGTEVRGWEPGQRVADLCVFGANSDYQCVPADRLVAVPDGLDAAKAVTLILSYLTAYQMLHRVARVQTGQHILVHGAGGAVGMALLQLGKLMDLDMLGTASAAKHDFVRDLGAAPIDYKTEDFVAHALEPGGVDAVFDAISAAHFRRSFKTLRPGGSLVAYGFYYSTLGASRSQAFRIVREYLRFQFDRLRWRFSDRQVTFYIITDLRKQHLDWFKTDLAKLFELALSGELEPVIWKTISLSEVASAHRLIESAQPQGKIVVLHS